MNYYIDVDYGSLNKYKEELCGDKVEIIRGEDSSIIVLADGLSHGVKANILATLTSKIIGTMLSMGSSIEQAVDTVMNTLPISTEDERAYSKLTILQLYSTGEGYLVEFENPKAIRLTRGKNSEFKSEYREIHNKQIRESRFVLSTDDLIVLVSDGAIRAGETSDNKWTWDDLKNYIERIYKKDISSKNVTKLLLAACNNLYNKKPEHDTTVVCVKIKNQLRINVLAGPPIDKALDNFVVNKFITSSGKKVVCGSTISVIVKRETGREWKADFNYLDFMQSPVVSIDGIDLVTEGRETLNKVLYYISEYVNGESSMPDIKVQELPAKLTRLLVDESTEVYFFVGRTETDSFENCISKVKIIKEIEILLKSLGKNVVVEYF